MQERICQNCGKDFESERKVFCSVECRREDDRRRRPEMVLSFACIECKKKFTADRERAFCSRDCYHGWQSKNQKFHVLSVGKIDMESETGGACLKIPGPCEFTTCRCHLGAIDAGAVSRRRLPDLPASLCAIRASRAERTLEEVAVIMGVTRERIRQIEAGALAKIRNSESKMETT